jgi:hypothetical protein
MRYRPALVAVLAAAALAIAAGGFATSEDAMPETTPEAGTAGPPTDSGGAATTPEGGDSRPASRRPTVTAAGSVTDGGISPVAVAGFTGTLAACLGLGVVLTGDDDRASHPAENADGAENGESTVAPSYGPVADNAVTRAWRRLAARAGVDETATPDETARLAAARGVPRAVAARLTAQFRAVRYGDEPVDARRERAVDEAMATLDGDTRAGEPDDVDGECESDRRDVPDVKEGDR